MLLITFFPVSLRWQPDYQELVLSIKEIVVNANRGRMVDAAVLQILQEEGSAYFCGEATLADCVAAIVKRLL